MTFGERLRFLREEKGLRQEDVAVAFYVVKSTISQWESSTHAPRDQNTLVKLADYFNSSIDYLLGRTDEPHPKGTGRDETKKILPLLGTIRAGLPILAEDNYEGELDIPADIEADFALRVTGDSMNGVGIYEGDYAICRQAQKANPGDIVVALRDDGNYSEATLKFFFNDNGKRPVLRAANPNYEDIPMNDGSRIGGIMIAQLRKEPPSYRIYREFISDKYSGYEDWVEAIETAVHCGVSPQQVKEIIKLQWDMVQRMAGKK